MLYSNNLSIVCMAMEMRSAQVTFAEKPQSKLNSCPKKQQI